jgi:carbonic anhydrase
VSATKRLLGAVGPLDWRRDLPASLVVFLIAVPLSLGIALASDAPIMAGLLAAAVGGIIVGVLAGAPLQVSGPAAGLTVVVFGLVEQLRDWRAVCFVVACAGLLQVALGLLGTARLALAISPAVVHGMLAGIGVSIVFGQLHVILGGTPQSSVVQNALELPGQLADMHGPGALLGLGVIVILFVWPLVPWPRVKAVPAPLVAVFVATALSFAFTGDGLARIDLVADDQVRPIEHGAVVETARGADDREHTLLAAIGLPKVPDAGLLTIVGAVLTLGLIASVESLLCAVATDKLHGGPRANLDRELVAQGVGNTVSGLIGGLPVTGVIVRSSANIASGAATRWSGVLHGVWVVVFVLFFGFVLESIPKAVLAGLLVFVGAKLINVEHMRQLARHRELPAYVVTVGGVVLKDLLTGVALGVATAIVLLLRRLSRVKVHTVERDGVVQVTVSGALTFVGVPRVTSALETVPPGRRVAVDLQVEAIDHAGLEALHAWRASYEKAGGEVDLDLTHDQVAWPREPVKAGAR